LSKNSLSEMDSEKSDASNVADLNNTYYDWKNKTYRDRSTGLRVEINDVSRALSIFGRSFSLGNYDTYFQFVTSIGNDQFSVTAVPGYKATGADLKNFSTASAWSISDIKNAGGRDGRILENGFVYAGIINEGTDAFAKTLSTNGLTAAMVNGGKTIVRYSGPAGVIISAGQVYNGYRKDGNQFGYNAQKATAGAVGETIGAWAGFKFGAWAGFETGFEVGLCFEGIGAIPGAVIGGIIGGFGCAFGGAYGGGKLGESLISK